MCVNLGVMVEPLLAQCGNEGGKEGSGKTGEKDALDVDEGEIGTGPGRV